VTTDQIGFILRELDQIQKSVDGVDVKVDDVRERVTRLETSSKTIKWLIGILLAGTPVFFLLADRILH